MSWTTCWASGVRRLKSPLTPARRRANSIAAVTLIVCSGLGWSVAGSGPVAAQAQASPTPRPTSTPRTPQTYEERYQALQIEKLEKEVRLLDMQEERVRQERDSQRQAWRAPSEALSNVGPTFVGLGLLLLLARALSHFLPPAPSRAAEPLDDDDE